MHRRDRERPPLQPLVAHLLACLVALTAARAQQDPTAVSPSTQAQRLVRLLELPERCSESWRALLQLRAAAAPPLAAALQDPRPDVAVRAAWLLAMLGAADAEAALPALRRGAATEVVPVARACRWALDRLAFRGTLLTDYGTHTVVHLGADGKELRRIASLRGPWFAEPVGEGNLLVSEYAGNCVRELDANGKEVWSFTDLNNPYQAQRLPGGNTLISDAGNNRVVEVAPDGKIVWEKKELKRPVAAERLPDGHTLVCEQQGGSVVELDAAGNEVWRHDGLNRPQRAQRLLNGNTLIALHQGGQVLEVDHDGKVVGEPLPVPDAQMAFRRPDGHVLIAATTYFQELDETGKEVWRLAGTYGVGILRQ